MTDEPSWNTNKILMTKLWPKWKPTPEQGQLLNERWGSLKQDILRTCIRDNAMQSRREPGIAAIHRAYCKITAVAVQATSNREVERTRLAATQSAGPSRVEYEEWDRWAADVLATASAQEIRSATARFGIEASTDRVRAVMVDYCRRNPAR